MTFVLDLPAVLEPLYGTTFTHSIVDSHILPNRLHELKSSSSANFGDETVPYGAERPLHLTDVGPVVRVGQFPHR